MKRPEAKLRTISTRRRAIDAPTLQTALSAVGSFIQPALKQKSASVDDRSLGQLVSQLADPTAGTGALQSFLTPQLQQQVDTVPVIADSTMEKSVVSKFLTGGIQHYGDFTPGDAATVQSYGKSKVDQAIANDGAKFNAGRCWMQYENPVPLP